MAEAIAMGVKFLAQGILENLDDFDINFLVVVLYSIVSICLSFAVFPYIVLLCCVSIYTSS